MATGQRKSPTAVGFLTVLDHSQHGLMGGYLVLNTTGRPLEFHCTAPLKPNRAQQILYGPTLEPYLYGEQIGHALVSKSSLAPLVIFTDRPPALAVRTMVDVPLALVLLPNNSPAEQNQPDDRHNSDLSSPRSADTNAADYRIDAAHEPSMAAGGAPFPLFMFGRNRLSVSPDRDSDRAMIQERLAELSESFDLAEPFDRIREAIEEAQRVGR
ncbi:MAG TPA: hypothetical protein VHX65_08670 [Pirellulales bacterium]|jgi:hypothetical protein|nr:hypothetical protein [Pirellulales bacterium]